MTDDPTTDEDPTLASPFATAKDPLGDRMKGYENVEAQRRGMPGLPVIARLDGRNFSAFTQGLQRPYDTRLQRLMLETTLHLVKHSGARCGYTQSDEITLVYHAGSLKSQLFFDGRFQKLCSVLASVASLYFNQGLPVHLPEKRHQSPVFDCRAWNVPSLEEAANCVLWREWDATKNSIQMAAQHHFSHRSLQGLNGKQCQEKLFQEKQVNWNDYPAPFKRGQYVLKRVRLGRFSPEELEALPPLHNARKNPDHEFDRSVVELVEIPPLGRILNRIDVLFGSAEPEVGPQKSAKAGVAEGS
jgi:tRNA(His) guanylyltransferase